MAVPAELASLAGEWQGANRVWLDPTQDARQSQTAATVGLAAQGRFLTLQHTWADQGQAQDGLCSRVKPAHRG
jgi:capsid protein